LISIIAAVSDNNVIGGSNKLLWYIPEDMKYFRDMTMGHPVIMGRKTWESIPAKYRPLEGRKNIVVSRDPYYVADGAFVCSSLDAALCIGNDPFVIGGAELYKLSLSIADVLYITEVHCTLSGDAFFPEITEDWKEVSRVKSSCNENLDFVKYIR
jgi:dihydrofolate reductase